MKDKLRRLVRGGLAALVIALFVIVPAQLDSPEAAHALCYPPSTINPACQPQNIPILIDAGVISGGGATTTTGATAAGAAAGPGVVSLGVNGAAGTAGFLALYLWLTGQDGDGKAHGVAGLNGVSGLKFDTDPAFLGSSPKGCITTPGKPGFLAPYNPGTGWPPTTSSGNYTPTAPASSMPRSCIMPAEVTVFNNTGGNTQRMVVTLSAALHPTINTLVVSSGATYAKWALYYLCKVGTGAVRYAQVAINSNGSNFQSTGGAGWFNPCGTAADTEIVALQHFDSAGAQATSILWNSATTVTNLPLADNNIRGTIRTTITCRPTGGGPDITVVVPGSVNTPAGGTVAVPDALCPLGYINVETEIDWKKPDETTWAPLIESAPTPDEITELPVLYPDCFPPSTKTCELTLWKIVPSGLDWCGQNGELCLGWAQQPGARDNYECRYGDYTIDIDRCSAFRYPEIGKLPNFTPDGDEIPIEAPAPVPLPGEVVDPVTGVPIDIPIPNPEAAPGTSNCFPTGWGVLNPISWVVQPVQCALQWAFVPRGPVITATLNGIAEPWEETPPGKISQIVNGWVFLPPAPGGCAGITVDVFFLGPPFQIMQACPGDMLAPLAYWSRFFGAAGFIVYAVVGVSRNFARIFEYRGLGGD